MTQISDLTSNPSPAVTDVLPVENSSDITYKQTVKVLLDLLTSSTFTTGMMATGRLGSGTADATTFLSGDQTYKVAIPENGWLLRSETWTRTGNHTFTVSTDLTTVFRKGTKVRYKDGGSYEYGVVASSSYSNPTTTVTLITTSDYAMASATITDKYISYIENPEGFPDWFNWAPTITGFSADPASGIYKWRAYGQTIKCFVRQPNSGTSNATTFTISAPVTAATVTNMQWGVVAPVTDNSVNLTTPGIIRIVSAGTVFDVLKDTAFAAFTNSGSKRIFSANPEYQF